MSDAVLTIQDFEPHVGTAFTIHTDTRDEILTLTEVTPSKHSFPGREPFSLVFNGSSNDLMLHSQLVHFKHDAMGDLTFMISPFGQNEDGTFRYEAVFN